MNGKKARKIRNIAKQISTTHETNYVSTKKHKKTYRNMLSKQELFMRQTYGGQVDANGNIGYNMDGFLDGSRIVEGILYCQVKVFTAILEPECLRAKYKALKKKWSQVVEQVSFSKNEILLNK